MVDKYEVNVAVEVLDGGNADSATITTSSITRAYASTDVSGSTRFLGFSFRTPSNKPGHVREFGMSFYGPDEGGLPTGVDYRTAPRDEELIYRANVDLREYIPGDEVFENFYDFYSTYDSGVIRAVSRSGNTYTFTLDGYTLLSDFTRKGTGRVRLTGTIVVNMDNINQP